MAFTQTGVHMCACLFFAQLCTNAQLSEKQPCMSVWLSVRQVYAHLMHACLPIPHAHMWLCQAQPHIMHWKRDYTCAHMHGYSSFSHALVGPYPKNPLYDPPYSPYLQIKNFTRCRRIGPLTCLSPLPDR
jgi:hypothetical protein